MTRHSRNAAGVGSLGRGSANGSAYRSAASGRNAAGVGSLGMNSVLACGDSDRGNRASPALNSVALVTGAAGFIGSHLTELLLARGQRVIGLDSLDPWYDPGQKRENLAAALDHGSFHLEIGDICTADLAALLTEAGVGVVYHLAARPGVQYSWGAGAAHTWHANVVGTQTLLDAALTAGVERVVLASSSSVYGDTAGPDGPRTLLPTSPYGVSKTACEQLGGIYARLGLEVVCLRYFTVFGPRQRPDMAMHRIIAAALDDGTGFVRRGDGAQTREFTFVGDVAEATAAAGTVAEAGGCALDIGGGSRASLNEVLSIVGRLTRRVVPVRYAPRPAGDPRDTTADISTARSVLGWRPRTSLQQGLEEQLEWHRKQLAQRLERSELASASR